MSTNNESSLSGVSWAAKQLLSTLFEIGHTRLELLTVELEEERLHWSRQLYVGAGVFIFGLVGALLACALVVMLCDPANRVLALSILTALFLGTSVMLALYARRLLSQKPPFLHASLTELARDREGFDLKDRV